MSVPGDRSFSRSERQKFVHLANASNFVTRGVDSEDEDKDDRKEHSSVGAAFAKKKSQVTSVVLERTWTY